MTGTRPGSILVPCDVPPPPPFITELYIGSRRLRCAPSLRNLGFVWQVSLIERLPRGEADYTRRSARRWIRPCRGRGIHLPTSGFGANRFYCVTSQSSMASQSVVPLSPMAALLRITYVCLSTAGAGLGFKAHVHGGCCVILVTRYIAGCSSMTGSTSAYLAQ